MLRIITFLILLATSGQVAAGAGDGGRIIGEIHDEESGEPLPGVVLRLEGTNRGTATDLNGHFEMDGLKSGTYTLRASLVGYDAESRRIAVRVGEEAEVDFHMPSSPIHLGEVLVEAEQVYSAASSSAVRSFDLQIRPSRTAHQMLQMAPGLVIAQHAGGGKAEQIFLRGFAAVHGTDVAIQVDGMPVNMVSHGHGQGYADLHFMIPEVIGSVDVHKGPYFPEHGNFATAGAIAFRTRDHLEENALRAEAGSFGTANYTLLYQLPMADPGQTAYFAGNFYRSDGSVDSPQDFHRFNIFSKVHTHLSERSTLTLDAGAFSSGWDASGQIPARAVRSGLIDRLGAIDDLEGGATGRRNLNLTFQSKGRNNSTFISQVYLSQYDFKLFSNFTFFLEDPVAGDMIEQTDDRSLLGINSSYSFYHDVAGRLSRATLGGGLRSDDADVGLWKSPDRGRTGRLVDSRILERNLYLWGREEITIDRRLHVMLGLRADYFTFNVADRLEGMPAVLPHASGIAQETVLSPKATLVFSPTGNLDLFANFGTGFHSNDARNVVIGVRTAALERKLRSAGESDAQIDSALAGRNFDPGQLDAEALPRATGGELGARLRPARGISLGAAAWWRDLEREFVWVGDAGTTEERGRTRRLGIDLEVRMEVRSWLWADADVNLSRGRLRDEPAGADDIPLAPTITSTGGLTARHPRGWEGALRYRHIGDRPANETDSFPAEGYTVFDLNGSYRFASCEVELVVENLFDVEWNEAQFDTESQLRGEVEPVAELPFTPGNPVGARVGVSYFF